MWAYLAFPGEQVPTPATGRMPGGLLLDYPLPGHPGTPFRADHSLFLRALGGLPAVREPWLRALYDRTAGKPPGPMV